MPSQGSSFQGQSGWSWRRLETPPTRGPLIQGWDQDQGSYLSGLTPQWLGIWEWLSFPWLHLRRGRLGSPGLMKEAVSELPCAHRQTGPSTQAPCTTGLNPGCMADSSKELYQTYAPARAQQTSKTRDYGTGLVSEVSGHTRESHGTLFFTWRVCPVAIHHEWPFKSQ